MRARTSVACLVLGGCIGPAPSVDRTYLLDPAAMPSVDEAGAAPGLDLDGQVSTGEGPTCVDRRADRRSSHDPSVLGIDNGLAEIGPTLEMLLGEVRLLEGERRLALEVRGIDRGEERDRVVVTLLAAPDRGDRLPIPIEPLAGPSEAVIEDGVLDVRIDGPFDLSLLDGRVDVGDFTLPMRWVRIRAQLGSERADVILAGAVDLDEVLRRSPPPECIMEPCPPVDPRPAVGDLDPLPDEPLVCSSMSLALRTEGFVFGASR